MIHLHNLDVWFLSLTDYYTPGFYCSLTPVKGAHLVLLRDNAIKSLFPVYFFWSQWWTQWHPPGGKLKARPYICFSSVNLLQYHWFQWHNMWLHLEKAIFDGTSPSPSIAGNQENLFWENTVVHLPFFILFYNYLWVSIAWDKALDWWVLCLLCWGHSYVLCRTNISRSAPSLLIQPVELHLRIHFLIT